MPLVVSARAPLPFAAEGDEGDVPEGGGGGGDGDVCACSEALLSLYLRMR